VANEAGTTITHQSVSLTPLASTYRGLIVDWGGVLTGNMRDAVRRWADVDGIDLTAYVDVMRLWLGDEGALEAHLNPVHALERGELEVPHFEERLAAELSERTGTHIDSTGLLDRMFVHFEHAHDMTGLVRRVHELGLSTALLSNSWGDNHYPDDLWDGMFDVSVISGRVGMRKPEERIFRHTFDLLGLDPQECLFIDDLEHNIRAGAQLGLIGILHVDYDTTLSELQILLGTDLT
jgi:putative hydrolase of the HAD superfamily